MSSNISNYKSNYFFRNQPSFTHFNKSFADHSDALFLGLNEINPIFLNNEQQQDELFQPLDLLDPRNKAPVYKNLIDYTKLHHNQSLYKPSLSNIQHVGPKVSIPCLSAAEDSKNIELFRKKMLKQDEKRAFLNYTSEYNITQTERIYAYATRMVALYKIWYRRRVQLIIPRMENFYYNTYSGLPIVRNCGSSQPTTDVVCVQMLDQSGTIPTWELPIEEIYDCIDFKNKLETYAAIGIQTLEDQAKFTNTITKDIIESDCYRDSYKYYMELDSLLFLLTPGEYPDLPTEMFLDIEEKLVKFHDPLPARNCGWHTHTKVVEQAFMGFQATSKDIQWLDLKSDASLNLLTCENLDTSTKADYLQLASKSLQERAGKMRSNCVLIDWQLQKSENTEKLQIFTAMQQAPKLTDLPGLRSIILKLEQKERFGYEVMTKYELLKEWFTLRFLSTHKDQISCRFRLSASTLQLLLTEKLVSSKIEQQLIELYNIKMPSLLSGLYDFLSILRSIPIGHYMLRFNEHFSDKFILCRKSLEKTQHSILLTELLLKIPSDFVFMTKQNFLPIADDLSSIAFGRNGFLSCTFPPTLKQKGTRSLKAGKVSTTSQKRPFNDRYSFLLKLKTKAIPKHREKISHSLCKRVQKPQRQKLKRKRKKVKRKFKKNES